MNILGGHITLAKHEYVFAMDIPRDIYHHNGMPWRASFYEHIPGTNLRRILCFFQLLFEGEGSTPGKDLLQITIKGWPVSLRSGPVRVFIVVIENNLVLPPG